MHRLSWQRSYTRIEKTSTPPLPCFHIQAIKAGINVKAVLTSLNTAFLSISWSMFQATLNPSDYFFNHCLAVLCKFLGDFWAFWERDIFF